MSARAKERPGGPSPRASGRRLGFDDLSPEGKALIVEHQRRFDQWMYALYVDIRPMIAAVINWLRKGEL